MQKSWMFALAMVVMLVGTMLVPTAAQDREPWDVPDEEKAVENPVPVDDGVIADGATVASLIEQLDLTG